MFKTALAKATKQFSHRAFHHRFRPKLLPDAIKKIAKLSKGFHKAQKLSAKERVNLVHNKEEMLAARKILYTHQSQHGLCERNNCEILHSAFLLFPKTKIISHYQRNSMLSTLMFVEDDSGGGLPADTIIGDELALYREKGYQLVELSSAALKRRIPPVPDCIEDSHLPYLRPVFSLLMKAFNYTYQFTNATHLFTLIPVNEKVIYDYIGFFQCAPEVKAPYNTFTNLIPMMLNMDKFLSLADKHIPAYVTLTQMQILEEENMYTLDDIESLELLTEISKSAQHISHQQKAHMHTCHPKLLNDIYEKAPLLKHDERRKTIQFKVDRNSLLHLLESDSK